MAALNLTLGKKPLRARRRTGSPRVPEKEYITILHLFGPTEPVHLKTWKHSDVTKVR
jgi:hypothetical protein